MSTAVCLVVDDSRVIRRMAAEIPQKPGLRTSRKPRTACAAVEFCRNTVPDMRAAGLEHAGDGRHHLPARAARDGADAAPVGGDVHHRKRPVQDPARRWKPAPTNTS